MTKTTTEKTQNSAALLMELETCRAATAREEELLQKLREKRPELLKAYAGDMQSASKRGELAALDDTIRHHEIELEALRIRESEAEATHAATLRAEKRAQLEELLRKCDPHVIETALLESYVHAIVAKEREIYELCKAMRNVCAGQCLYAAEADKLAEELGENIRVRRVRSETIRVAGSYLIGGVRQLEKREDESTEFAITPATDTYVWIDGYKQPSRVGSAEDFDRAKDFLARTLPRPE